MSATSGESQSSFLPLRLVHRDSAAGIVPYLAERLDSAKIQLIGGFQFEQFSGACDVTGVQFLALDVPGFVQRTMKRNRQPLLTQLN